MQESKRNSVSPFKPSFCNIDKVSKKKLLQISGDYLKVPETHTHSMLPYISQKDSPKKSSYISDSILRTS